MVTTSKRPEDYAFYQPAAEGNVPRWITHVTITNALMGQFQRICHLQKYGHARKPYQERLWSQALSGKDADRQSLQQHRHAFYWPTAEGSDPRWITPVTLAAAGDFGPEEVAACSALCRLKVDDESPELRVQLVGLGKWQDFRARLLDEATAWVSATIFLASRYPKTRGTKRDRPEDYASPQAFVRHVLRQELERRWDLPPIASIREEEFLVVPGLAQKTGRRRRPSAHRRASADVHGPGSWPVVPEPFVPRWPGPLCAFDLKLPARGAVMKTQTRGIRTIVL